eukprot:7381879-Prymnesium_polylepis.2
MAAGGVHVRVYSQTIPMSPLHEWIFYSRVPEKKVASRTPSASVAPGNNRTLVLQRVGSVHVTR